MTKNSSAVKERVSRMARELRLKIACLEIEVSMLKATADALEEFANGKKS